MAKTWEHYRHAAYEHEWAAYHFQEAAKYDEAEEREKAAHHAYLARGHNLHAIHHDAAAIEVSAAQGGDPAIHPRKPKAGLLGTPPASAPRDWKKSAA